MKVILVGKALKQLARLNEPLKSRIKKALRDLEKEPPDGDIKPLKGRDGYRARKGGFRLLFDKTDRAIQVFKIESRGQVYKGRGKHK
ncbi:MAG: type II toxin-antitoxin system RelE/ParE family toxin [Treponematales bacterium]